MTEQDIINKIKESAATVEIPESLKPEAIERKLKMQKKPARFRWQAMHLVAAAVGLVIMLGIVPIGLMTGGSSPKQNIAEAAGEGASDGAITGEAVEDSAKNAAITEGEKEVTIEKKRDAGELYMVAESYDEVSEFLEEYVTEYQKYYGADPEEAVEEAETLTDGAAMDMRTNSSSMQEAIVGNNIADLESAMKKSADSKTSYSTTNRQMAGVDESDIVKINGTHIFMVKDGAVEIVKIDNGSLEQIASLSPELESFSDSVLEMYVDGDKLMLIVQQVKNEFKGTATGKSADGFLPLGEEIACVDYAYNYNIGYCTVLYTYDISNPAAPKQVGKVEQDGFYKTSRKIEDKIYLFTQDSLMAEEAISEDGEVTELLPKVNGEMISYDCIYLPESGYQGLVISSVSLDNPDTVVDNILILNDYVEIYVSSSAVYLYHTDYFANMENTQIAKFSIKEGEIQAVGAATVPGVVQDTFAINEYQGNLRVLTSHWDSNLGDETNQLYILDESLKAAGKIENIAQGESIYAARYFGNLAYFITYRNIDPLFVADLSDIYNPKILGELEITGYSEYLHMWGTDKLLGIGYETDPETGRQEGIKLVMFDISNPAKLSIVDTVVLKDADYSTALYNYKCVLADANTNMIGVTVSDFDENKIDYYVYSFADGKFAEELVIESSELRYEASYRGLYSGEYFYFANPAEIKSFKYTENYKAVDELKF